VKLKLWRNPGLVVDVVVVDVVVDDPQHSSKVEVSSSLISFDLKRP